MMKVLKYILLILVLTATATKAEAKIIVAEHMYIFGFSASFNDSILYMTDIQDVQGASYDTKNDFLLARDLYSSQLKEYLAEKKGQPNRVCLVMFSTSKKKAEKKYQKLKKLDAGKDGVIVGMQFLTSDDFKFEAVELSDE